MNQKKGHPLSPPIDLKMHIMISNEYKTSVWPVFIHQPLHSYHPPSPSCRLKETTTWKRRTPAVICSPRCWDARKLFQLQIRCRGLQKPHKWKSPLWKIIQMATSLRPTCECNTLLWCRCYIILYHYSILCHYLSVKNKTPLQTHSPGLGGVTPHLTAS